MVIALRCHDKHIEERLEARVIRMKLRWHAFDKSLDQQNTVTGQNKQQSSDLSKNKHDDTEA